MEAYPHARARDGIFRVSVPGWLIVRTMQRSSETYLDTYLGGVDSERRSSGLIVHPSITPQAKRDSILMRLKGWIYWNKQSRSDQDRIRKDTMSWGRCWRNSCLTISPLKSGSPQMGELLLTPDSWEAELRLIKNPVLGGLLSSRTESISNLFSMTPSFHSSDCSTPHLKHVKVLDCRSWLRTLQKTSQADSPRTYRTAL